MQKYRILIVALAVIGGGAWYAFRPERLFIDRVVSEPMPVMGATTGAATGSPSMMPASRVASEGEATPAPVALESGRFHGVHHETKGRATVYRMANGKRVLRFTEFETSNGPDVQVYLVAAPDAQDNATVTKAGFVNLGAMKGNRGDQNYEVPDGVDLAKYRAVTIWCRRFAVNFGSAPLAAS